MTRTGRAGRIAGACALAALVAACSDSKPSNTQAPAAGAQASGPQEKYPEPRWPSYFKPPKSADDLMPAARVLVRNRSGFQGKGMGILEPGESVLIVHEYTADPMVLEAVRRALVERKITPHIKASYELLGVSKEQAGADYERSRQGRKIDEAGMYQATQWIVGQFPNPDQPKAWLKERNDKLYAQLFPDEVGESAEAEKQRRERNRRSREDTGAAIQAYLRAHPEIRGVFWGQGGSTGLRRQLYPMQAKFLGTFMSENIYNIQSLMSSYPGDLWQLAEEQTLEPISYASEVRIDDPEGTHLSADITPEMADKWSQGAYQRGHLYMFPNQATGRFGYSFVNYPAFQGRWLAREPITRVKGVLAGTQGHGGFFPRWEVDFKDGFISEVRGGGAQGDALRLFLHYPGINNDLTYPYHNQPGYWYLYEIAFGSHPKGFRYPTALLDSGTTQPERARSGVIHWGLGIRLWHDPDAPTESKVWREFSRKHNVPFDHGWHTHTYFTTYQVKLRNADKWVKLLDKGRMTSLDDPEVRALASRYGDPDYLLAEDWIPEVPGVNAPGDYMKDYAPNPGKYALMVLDKAMKGTYANYFPAAGTNISIKPSGKPITDTGDSGEKP